MPPHMPRRKHKRHDDRRSPDRRPRSPSPQGRRRVRTPPRRPEPRLQREPAFRVGDEVEYHSSSYDKWIEGKVLVIHSDGTLDLDVRERAHPSAVRHVQAEVEDDHPTDLGPDPEPPRPPYRRRRVPSWSCSCSLPEEAKCGLPLIVLVAALIWLLVAGVSSYVYGCGACHGRGTAECGGWLGSCVCADNYAGLYCDLDCGCGIGTQTDLLAARAAGTCWEGSCEGCGNHTYDGELCDCGTAGGGFCACTR